MSRRRGAVALGAAVALVLSPGMSRAQRPDSIPAAAGDSVARGAPLPPDRWLGEDKVKHLFVAGFVYAGGFAVARLAGLERRGALAAAAGPAALVSLGKELRDRRVTGRFSLRDLAADALGIAAYASLLSRTAR